MASKRMTFKRARTEHYDDPVEVGKRIFEAREAAGFSQRQLAFPGCSAAYISRMERGERIGSLQVLRVIASRTFVTVSWLTHGRESIDPTVAKAIHKVEGLEESGTPEDLADAYKELARAATRAAKAVNTAGN